MRKVPDYSFNLSPLQIVIQINSSTSFSCRTKTPLAFLVGWYTSDYNISAELVCSNCEWKQQWRIMSTVLFHKLKERKKMKHQILRLKAAQVLAYGYGFLRKNNNKKTQNSMKKLKYPEKKIHKNASDGKKMHQWKKKWWYVQNVTEQIQNVGKQNCQICKSIKKTVICLNDYTRQELLLHFHHVLHHAPLWDRNWWQPTALIKQSGLWYICHRGKIYYEHPKSHFISSDFNYLSAVNTSHNCTSIMSVIALQKVEESDKYSFCGNSQLKWDWWNPGTVDF